MEQGKARTVNGIGNGTIDAAVKALGGNISIIDYHEHALGTGSEVEAVCYIEMQIDDGSAIFGVGVHRNIISAAIKAIFNGLGRHRAAARSEEEMEAIAS